MSEVIIDKNSIKALSSDNRIKILQSLEDKNKTVSELSRELNINKSALLSHLSILIDAGLIRKKQRIGHKWVYYTLSWSGKSVLHPQKSNIMLIISVTIISIICFSSLVITLNPLSIGPEIEHINYEDPDIFEIQNALLYTYEDEELFININELSSDYANNKSESKLKSLIALSNAGFIHIDNNVGIISGKPNNNDVGFYYINLIAITNGGTKDQINFTLEVINTNDPPLISLYNMTLYNDTIVTMWPSSNPLVAKVGKIYSYYFNATDPDVNDTINWSLNTNASFLHIKKETGLLYGLPLPTHIGKYDVKVTVTDTNGSSDSIEFILTVKFPY